MFQAIYAEQPFLEYEVTNDSGGLDIPKLKRSVQNSYYNGKDLFPSNMTDATQKLDHSSKSTIALKVCKSYKKNDTSEP